jgi:hypothetical protein
MYSNQHPAEWLRLMADLEHQGLGDLSPITEPGPLLPEQPTAIEEAATLGLKLRFSVDGVGAGWTCVDDNTFDGPGSLQGWGRSKEEAARELLEQWHDRFDDDKAERDEEREPEYSHQTGFSL